MPTECFDKFLSKAQKEVLTFDLIPADPPHSLDNVHSFEHSPREGFIKKIGGIFHRGGGQPIPPNLFFNQKNVFKTTPNGLKHENNTKP